MIRANAPRRPQTDAPGGAARERWRRGAAHHHGGLDPGHPPEPGGTRPAALARRVTGTEGAR